MTTQELRARSRTAATLPHPYGPVRSAPLIQDRRRRHHVAAEPATSHPIHDALRIGDAIALFIGFAVPLLLVAERGPSSPETAIFEAAVLVAVGVWATRFHGLWSTQVMAVRSIELSRIFRVLVTIGALALVFDRQVWTNLRVVNIVFAGAVGGVVLVGWRAAYRAYVHAERRRGRFTLRVAVVGTGRQANELTKLFVVHPELGMRVSAVIGVEQEAEDSGMAQLWRGGYHEARQILEALDVDVVALCTSELDRWLIRDLSAEARARGRTIYVDPGLSGIDFRRVRTTSVGYQPLLEMSAPSLSGLQAAVKRGFDIVMSSFVAVLTAPLQAIIAALIKLEDGDRCCFGSSASDVTAFHSRSTSSER